KPVPIKKFEAILQEGHTIAKAATLRAIPAQSKQHK
ncbi:MAG: hypothetical protein ACJA13_002135, partial [Paraglaciecola sp.]